MKITDNERKAFEFIKQKIEDEGYPPTVRELCSHMGYTSTSSAFRLINMLADKGFIEKGSGKNRAIRLAGGNSVKIPLVGTVAAGIPITAIEYVSEYISFRPERNYSGELFALKVKGDSMINAAILDGDIVVVEQTSVAENGEIIVALVDGESATVKTFYKEDGHYRLQPENDTMEPIIVDEVAILGKVVGVLRYL